MLLILDIHSGPLGPATGGDRDYVMAFGQKRPAFVGTRGLRSQFGHTLCFQVCHAFQPTVPFI